MKYFLRFSGISILLLFIYFRFIVERMPKDLRFFVLDDNLNIHYNYKIIAISMIATVISSFIIILHIKKLSNKPIKFSSNIIINTFSSLIIYIKNALNAVKELCAQKIPGSYDKLYSICSFFYKKFGYYEKELCVFLLIIPYVIVVCCFVVDVFVFFRLNYFYKSIIFLCVPLTYNTFLYFMEDISNNLNTIEKELLVEHTILPNGKDKISFHKRPEYELSNTTFELYVNEYLKLIPFRGFLKSYFEVEDRYKTRLFIFVHFVYLAGWLFVITSNIFYMYL